MAPILERLKPLADLAGSYVWDNPVFIKELRLHFRSRNVTLMQGAYLALVAVFLGALTLYAELSAQTGGRAVLWMVGKSVFGLLYVLHFLLLAVLLPSAAAGTVTSEKESRTLELLDSLPMGKGRLVAGKFSALLVIAGLFLLSGMPLFILALQMLGGVTPKDLLCAFLSLLGFAVLFNALGVLSSSTSDSYRGSIFLCLRIMGLLLLLLVGCRLYGPFAGAFAPQAAGLQTEGIGAYYRYQHVPMVGPFAGLLSSLMWAAPMPSSLQGALLLLFLCLCLAAPLLTAAADHLRPPYEKRPYLLTVQFAALYLLIIGSFLRSTAKASWIPGSEMLLLETTCLFCLSAYVLPQQKLGHPGWRGALSGGVRDGALLLAACVLATYAAWSLAFAGRYPASPSHPGLSESGMLMGQLFIGLMVPFWAASAFACARVWPEKARQLYVGLHLALVGAPLVANAFLSDALKSLNACLLSLDPWLVLPLLDDRGAASVSAFLRLPHAEQMLPAALALIPLAAVGLWKGASAWAGPKKRRQPTSPSGR